MRNQLLLIFIVLFSVSGELLSSGRAEEISDQREPTPRTEAERAFVLDQMRLFLTSIAEIEDGLGSDDMERVAREAAARGRKANVTLARPSSLASKENEAWKMMIGSARSGFDQIAEEAAAHAPISEINKTLADTMRNCVACHQTYRITLETR